MKKVPYLFAVLLIAGCQTTYTPRTYSDRDIETVKEWANSPQGSAGKEYAFCLMDTYSKYMKISQEEKGEISIDRSVTERLCKLQEKTYWEAVSESANCTNSQCPINTANTVIGNTKYKAFQRANYYLELITNENQN